MRGQPPKPTSLKLLEGNKGKRALNKGEPQPDYLDKLDPPAHLSAEAGAVWRELAFPLRKAQVLTVLDVHALEMACNAIALYRRATALANGVEIVEKDGGGDDAKGKPQAKARPMGFVGEGGEPGGAEGSPQAKGEAKAAAPAGGAHLNPWLLVQSMTLKQALNILRDFGMTPAARARVVIEPQGDLFGNAGGKESYLT